MMVINNTPLLPFDKFAYWLQGFAELQKTPPSPEQWEEIKRHLAMCFAHVTVEKGATPEPYVPHYDPPQDLLRRFGDNIVIC